ncbi:MAG: CDP-archaeol synthase [Legionellales bacterium]|nr:CDP-archaeol synthase [Legionellales bacterium]
MLKQRILTAALLIPLVLLCLLYLPLTALAMLSAILILGCAWEWLILCEIKQRALQVSYLLFIAASCYGLWYADLSLHFSIYFLATLGWIFASALIFTFPKNWQWWQFLSLRLIAGLMLFIPTWLGLNQLVAYPAGRYQLILVLVFIWSADSGAYFAGRAWGKHLLAPKVSPKKTWEGVSGGVMGGMIVAILGVILFKLSLSQAILYLIIGVMFVFISIVGDLTESMVKRQQGVKDSGTIFPGHGGLLDRLDSLFAVIPLFALVELMLRGMA